MYNHASKNISNIFGKTKNSIKDIAEKVKLHPFYEKAANIFSDVTSKLREIDFLKSFENVRLHTYIKKYLNWFRTVVNFQANFMNQKMAGMATNYSSDLQSAKDKVLAYLNSLELRSFGYLKDLAIKGISKVGLTFTDKVCSFENLGNVMLR